MLLRHSDFQATLNLSQQYCSLSSASSQECISERVCVSFQTYKMLSAVATGVCVECARVGRRETEGKIA